MRPILLLLLLSACLCRVAAQQEPPQAGAAPVRQNLPQETAAPAGGPACPHCTPDEQLIVDLLYYKQALDILEQVDQQRSRIDAGLLRSLHAELARTRPNLAAWLKTAAKKPERAAAAPEKPKKVVKKPARTVQKPPPAQGIEGLTVGHVNEENSRLGIKPSVVLVSHGRPRSLSVGGVIEHNRRKYKVLKVAYVEDARNGNRHEVHLQEQAGKKIHIVPWQ